MKPSLNNSILKNSLTFRFLLFFLVVSSLTTLLATLAQLYFHHQIVQYSFQSLSNTLQTHYLPIINQQLKNPTPNAQQIQLILEEMTRIPNIQQATITKNNQLLFNSGTLSFAEESITYQYPMFSQTYLGTLQVSLHDIPNSPHFLQNFVINSTTNILNLLLIALFVFWWFQKQIIPHLQKLSTHLQQLDFKQLDKLCLLDRPPHHQDEFSQIAQQLNQTQNKFQQTLQILQDTRQEAQTLLNTAPIGLVLWRLSDGQLQEGNLTFAHILGRSSKEISALNYWQHIISEKERFQTQLKTLAAGERYGPLEQEYCHKDGYPIPVKVTLLILEKANLRYVWSVVENITSQKLHAKELQQTIHKAEEANRAKTQFLANMSHELRTPINTIVGYSEILEDEVKECKRLDLLRDVRNIHTSAKHLLGLLDGILDISKIEAGKMELYVESFDLKEIIQQVINTIQPLIENRVNTLIKDYQDDQLGQMKSDTVKVKQILLNLLSNASKFTENGQITLHIRRETRDNQECIMLGVEDEGIGMTQEQQDCLFQVFAQADPSTQRKYGGSGLGLAITKYFTEMLGGRIEVTSQFGKGSHFIVYLPTELTISPQETFEKSIRKPSLPAESGIVLVIDDDDVVRNLLQAYLSKIGYQVALADNGKEGLALAKKLRPNAITLDVMMPGMDGWEVLSQLKADPDLAHIPVIVLTMVEDKDIGYSLGAAEFLTKPVTRDQLTKVLRKYRSETAPRKIMIVEDDNTTREMMVRMLHKMGWQVIEAENGEVALRLLETHSPDLILLDLMMPEMDGFEFIVHLRQHKTQSQIPVVVLTAKDITTEDRTWLSHQVNNIFQKGAYSREELLAELRAILSKTTPKL